jgi:hypothetical protein
MPAILLPAFVTPEIVLPAGGALSGDCGKLDDVGKVLPPPDPVCHETAEKEEKQHKRKWERARQWARTGRGIFLRYGAAATAAGRSNFCAVGGGGITADGIKFVSEKDPELDSKEVSWLIGCPVAGVGLGGFDEWCGFYELGGWGGLMRMGWLVMRWLVWTRPSEHGWPNE